MSNNGWAAVFGVVCLAATGFVLGPAVLKRPFPKTKPESSRTDDGTPESGPID